MSDASNPTSDGAKPAGTTPDGATVVKGSKQGGAKPAKPPVFPTGAAPAAPPADADADTEAQMRAAAFDDPSAAELTEEEQAVLSAASQPRVPATEQKCLVTAEYTAGEIKGSTTDPDSPLARKWAEKGIRVFVKAVKPDGTVIGMRTMAAEQARETMRTALSGGMVNL